MADATKVRSLIFQLTQALQSARSLLPDDERHSPEVPSGPAARPDESATAPIHRVAPAPDGPTPSRAPDSAEPHPPLNKPDLLHEMQFLRQRVAELAARTTGEILMHAAADTASPEGRVQINWPEQLLSVPDAAPAALAAGAGSDKRIAILKLLYSHAASSAELGKAVGLRGGALFHHLSALRTVGLVTLRGRNDYVITNRGRDVLLTLLLMSKRNDTGAFP